MSEQSDAELIEEIARANTLALQMLYARYGLELLNFLLSRTEDRRLAEEVLQNVMLAVWESAGQFRAESSVRTWLYAITRRRLASAWRSAPPLDLPLYAAEETGTDTPDSKLEVKTEREALAHAIDQLPEDQQEALELFFFRDLSLAEAAQHMGINVNTLKSKLHRAKQNLRQIMQET